MSRRSVGYQLPWPPSVNKAWTPGKRGRRICMLLTTAQRDYRMAVNHVVRENRVAKFTGPVGVSIVLEPKTRARYDCDNFCKSILDALTGANVWVDDGQVQTLRVSKAAPRAGGRATVLVYEMTGEMLNA